MFLWRKYSILVVIAITTAIPPLFMQLDEPTLRLQIFKFLAKTGSLAGVTLMFWQALLGFRGTIARFVMPDLMWILNLHKKIGSYVIFLILLHPVFISLYYLEKYAKNLFSLSSMTSFDAYVILGILSLVILVIVVITSVNRKFIKNYSIWYSIHLSTYILLPLAFIHSFPIGMTLRETSLKYIWWCMVGSLVIFYLYRISVRFGLFVKQYIVIEVKKVTPQVTQITMRPQNGGVKPRTGQFIVLRWGVLNPARPFTVSHYDKESGELSVTVKALGKITTRLKSIQPDEIVYIEGPYGVFTRTALESNRPLVMIAGGIGITPFNRLFDELTHQPGREVHLFYGNKFTHEIVYKEEIEDMQHVNVIHVVSDDPDYEGERGYITIELMKKYLTHNLSEYEFLICGPPVMTEKLKNSLARELVPAEQIHYEQFSW